MKLAVCIKQVVSREWHLRIDPAGTRVRDEDASWTLNEPDAYALEAALRLAEPDGSDVIAVSAGPARVTQVLREALARGATRAIHVHDDRLAAAEPAITSAALAEALRDEHCDLILTGLQSDDQGFGQTGVMLAERLGATHATIIMEIQPAGTSVRVKRELEDGWFQWVTLPLPAVLTIQSGINQLRYATLKGIMASKKKELRTVTPVHLPAASQRLVTLRLPEKRRSGRIIGGSPAEAAAELIRNLRQGDAI
jgi:electron transfer flavoprotein beta subunit